MENPSHSFRDEPCASGHKKEPQIKSKTVVSWTSRKKKEGIFCTVYFVQKNFFEHLYFILMY